MLLQKQTSSFTSRATSSKPATWRDRRQRQRPFHGARKPGDPTTVRGNHPPVKVPPSSSCSRSTPAGVQLEGQSLLGLCDLPALPSPLPARVFSRASHQFIYSLNRTIPAGTSDRIQITWHYDGNDAPTARQPLSVSNSQPADTDPSS